MFVKQVCAQFTMLIAFALPLMAAHPSSNTPATVTFRCPATADCIAPDQIQGDWQGSYCCNVADYFFNSAALFMYIHTPRSIFLDFSQPDGQAPCQSTATGCRMNFTTATTTSPAPGTEVNPTDAQDVVLPNGFFGIPVGGSAYARVKINFPDPSGRPYLWTVRFDSGAYPGSTNVTVRRLTTNTWEVEAYATDRARLVSVPTSGKQVMTDEGLYVMPFKMTVSN